MDFQTMWNQLESHRYLTFEAFEADFGLIVNNCLKYNAKDTVFYRAALRLREMGGAVMRTARRQAERIGFDYDAGLHLPREPSPESQRDRERERERQRQRERERERERLREQEREKDSLVSSNEDGEHRPAGGALRRRPLLPSTSGSDHPPGVSPLADLLLPENRRRLPLEEQLHYLQVRLDELSGGKHSIGQSRRAKALRKEISVVKRKLAHQREGVPGLGGRESVGGASSLPHLAPSAGHHDEGGESSSQEISGKGKTQK